MFFKKKSDKKVKKSPVREWFDAILFAVIAASLIRSLFVEAFKIPTPSMEKTLLVGDYLFVSKFHYGARMPITPLQVPLTHQTIWGTSIPSFSDLIQLNPIRLPGISEVKRGDVVVFNYPPGSDYDPNEKDYPIDLKTNYIKRCVGIPGDQLEVRNRQLFIQGEAVGNPEMMQHAYWLLTKQALADRVFLNNDITEHVMYPLEYYQRVHPEEYDTLRAQKLNLYLIHSTQEIADRLSKLDFIARVENYEHYGLQQQDPDLFIRNYPHKWNKDHMGPITIPAEGMKINIDALSLATYGYAIKKYEHHEDVRIEEGKLFIDGKEIQEYVFRQNYYFMMGDNRHNSLDSRAWGFVPEDHIVGKGIMVWWSVDPNGVGFMDRIRWDRLFSTIN